MDLSFLQFRADRINCYSLNSIGPTAERLGGPKRFLAVYLTFAAVASSTMGYLFNEASSIGASGAIFGVVAVFVIRHKKMVRDGNENLRQIALSVVSRGIDSWGHVSKPKCESTTRDGRRVFMDMAPLPLLLWCRNKQLML
ncbi:hypothetical protein BRARA_I03068 [Brassica rapa]|uniref:Peptidase S54 rhomboid domain-containing protein n=1 Tax=Brassica campestris TaxID=3711 RepID=A0A397Y3Z1_BRACM|nr:hypothetical protein BRARA_I03068 [Brassica rapa]